MTSAAMHAFGKRVFSCTPTRLPEKNHTPRIFRCPSEFMFSEAYATSNFPQIKGLIEADLPYWCQQNQNTTLLCAFKSGRDNFLSSTFEGLDIFEVCKSQRPDFKM